MKTITLDVCGTCGKARDKCTCAEDNKGAKFDDSKLRFDLVPTKEFIEVVKVLTKGAEKYDDNNWQKVPNGENRYYAALQRHANSYRMGNKIDKDSGIHAMAHVICNALFLMWLDNNKDKQM